MTLAPIPADQRMRQGGALFLVSLSVFFVGGMVLYFLWATWRRAQFGQHHLPAEFLTSTFLLAITSGSLFAALLAVRRERQAAMLWGLGFALLSGLLFLLIQSFGMSELVVHGMLRSGTGGLWGMVVILALLHALHVAGGVIGLVVVAVGAYRRRYDHERHWPVEFVGNYWHFLDVVWLAMLAAFYMTSSGFER